MIYGKINGMEAFVIKMERRDNVILLRTIIKLHLGDSRLIRCATSLVLQRRKDDKKITYSHGRKPIEVYPWSARPAGKVELIAAMRCS